MKREPDFDAIDAVLIDALHDSFPLTDRPFEQVAVDLGLGEAEVIGRLRRLLDRGVLTRFGPLVQAERAGGGYLLAALAVPQERFDEVAAQVDAHVEVAHNYRRQHRINMWFVVAAESPQAIDDCVRAIEAQTGLAVLRFPKEREYRVELRLPASAAFTQEQR